MIESVTAQSVSKKARLRFSFRIARRYLFSKKSHNAINVISGISSAGVAIGTMALVIVLSVFNGFEQLFTGLFSDFDPELKITLTEGKHFSIDTPEFQRVRNLASVEVFSEVVQENALLRFRDKQMPTMIKGVNETDFRALTHIDSILFEGEFTLYDGAFERAVAGLGVASTLGLGSYFIDPLYIYAPKRNQRINMLRPEKSFIESAVFMSGIFSIQQNEYDNQYLLVSLNLARELFEYAPEEVTAIELKLKPGADVHKVKDELSAMLGSGFQLRDRYEQQESYFTIMRIEKWITFLILSFILLIAVFNVIGALSMLIIDKKADIVTLRNLGADRPLIQQIFLLEGWLISAVGAVTGLILGAGLSLLQEHLGIIRLGAGYIIDKYPAATQFSDLIIVFSTVLVMGFLAALYPVRYIKINSSAS
ncbi:MAG: ABC transporter permease [Paludibacter sp.]|jgi:ABC-type lipoprotein release transport system permease subunit|nr:ABC transporter permease [Paludibacter sp.]